MNNISRKYIRTGACNSNTVILEASGLQGRDAASRCSFETSRTKEPHNAEDPNVEQTSKLAKLPLVWICRLYAA